MKSSPRPGIPNVLVLEVDGGHMEGRGGKIGGEKEVLSEEIFCMQGRESSESDRHSPSEVACGHNTGWVFNNFIFKTNKRFLSEETRIDKGEESSEHDNEGG